MSLEYSRVRTRWWTGAVFRPSVRSLVLLLLIAPTIAWLVRRHMPWRADAFVASEHDTRRPTPTYDSHVWFLPNNQMLTFSQANGVSRIDLATGKIVKTICACERGTGYLELDNGRMAVVPPHSPTLQVYDVQSGSKVRELPNPVGAGYSFVAMSGDGSRMVTGAFRPRVLKSTTRASGVALSAPRRMASPSPARVTTRPAGPPKVVRARRSPRPRTEFELLLWDLPRQSTVESLKPTESLRASTATSFEDKQGLLVFDHSSNWTVVDLATMRRELDFADPLLNTPHRFGNYHIKAISLGRTALKSLLYDAKGDEIDQIVELTPYGYWSPDLSLRVERPSAGPTMLAARIDFVDRITGRIVRSISDRNSPPRFFPDSKKYVVISQVGPRFQTGIFDFRHDQPLAVLDDEPAARFIPDSIDIAPDANTILKRVRTPMQDGYLLFHRTGWDCPESALGMLAFPHLWLLAALILLASISLMNDARIAAPLESPHLPGLVMAGLWLASVVLTIDFVLGACRGNLIRSPAPLLLLLTIGLAGRSSFWRVAGLIILSVATGWCCFLILKMPANNVVGILDRNYDIPQQLRRALAGMAIAGSLLCLILLALPRRADVTRARLI